MRAMRYQEPFSPEYGPVKAPYQEVHYAGTSREETVVRYANGLAFVSRCMTRETQCNAEATQTLLSESFCLEHAEAHWNRTAQNERNLAQWEAENADMLRAEARAEQLWEMRANGLA